MSEGFEGREGKDLASVPASATIPAPLVDLVLDGLASPHSRRAYGRALEEFFSWYPSNAPGEGFNRATVQRYRSHLTERALSAASMRKLAADQALARAAVQTVTDSPLLDQQLAPMKPADPPKGICRSVSWGANGRTRWALKRSSSD